jgi:hypothetical protein
MMQVVQMALAFMQVNAQNSSGRGSVCACTPFPAAGSTCGAGLQAAHCPSLGAGQCQDNVIDT